jgi:hypothetical protein
LAECPRWNKGTIESVPAMILVNGKVTINAVMADVAKERPGVTNV